MRDNSFDRTIERNYLQKWVFLIKEYEEVKAGRSEVFPTVGAFYHITGRVRRRSASITTAIYAPGARRTCCRNGADLNGASDANRRESRRRSSRRAGAA